MDSKLAIRVFIMGILLGVLSTIIVSTLISPTNIVSQAIVICLVTGLTALISVRSALISGGGRRSKSQGSREEGVVKWFNINKGFGFITRRGGSDIFVHQRFIRGRNRRFLKEGQRVAFRVGNGDKGLQAEDVVTLSNGSGDYRRR